MGVSQSSVANKIRLLNLTEEAQVALMNEKISERHARSLLQLTEPEAQINMLNKIINERLTVRQLDEEIKKVLNLELLEEVNPKEKEETIERFEILNNLENQELLKQIETLDLNFNEFKEQENPTEKILEEKYEIFDIPTAEEYIAPSKEVKETKKIKSGDLNSVITTFKDIETEVKDAGFQIETEEYDFEDLYQIIIKIEK